MQLPDDIETVWRMWEKTVLNKGLEDCLVEQLGQHIEQLEGQNISFDRVQRNEPITDALARGHKIFDQLCNKRSQQHKNATVPGYRIMKTRYGVIYENSIIVRGFERLIAHQSNTAQAIRLQDGIYHINHLPGVQPHASELSNARNKNVERIDRQVIDKFIALCQATGMSKRGWKKSVNDQFNITRQEFSKWISRYFPLYNLSITTRNKR